MRNTQNNNAEPTRYFHRLNPQTWNAYTIKRFWDDKTKGKTFRPINQETDRDGKPIHAPYIAGGETENNFPPKERLTQLWDDVYKAPRLYIVEGEKCAESLKNALKTPDLDGAVLTMGACNLAHIWTSWAGYLSNKNPKAQIIIFGDNDKPGRDAVKDTAEAFHAAGFRDITIFDMARRSDGKPAPKKYDIADWLEEADLQSLIETGGRGYDYVQWLECLQVQFDRQKKLDAQRAERAAWRLTKDDLDESFPLDALSENLKSAVIAIGEKFGVPLGAACAGALTTVSGFLGPYKATLWLNANDLVFPMIHTCIVGGSGEGKTRVINNLLTRVRYYSRGAKDWTEQEKNKLPWFKKQLDAAIDSNDENEITKLTQKIRVLESQGAAYITSYVSPQAILEQLYTNENYARINEKTTNGLVIWQDDADILWNVGGSKGDNNKTGAMWGKLNQLADGFDDPGIPVTRKGAGRPKNPGVSFLSAIQETGPTFLDYPTLRGNGWANRQLWHMYPEKRYDPQHDAGVDISESLAPYYHIFDVIDGFKGAPFYCDNKSKPKGYSAALKCWSDRNGAERDAAKDAGEKERAAWLAKQYQTVNAIALNLHFCDLAGAEVDFFTAHYNESSLVVPFKGIDPAPPWAFISPETFERAAKLDEYFYQARNICWRFMEHATAKSPATISTAPTTLESSLSPQALKIYKLVMADRGKTLDCEKIDDDRVSTVTTIRDRSHAFRNSTTQKTILDELGKAGLCYRNPQSKNPKTIELVFLRERSLEELAALFAESETPQEEQPAPDKDAAQAPLDCAPEVDVLLSKSAEGASQSIKDDYTTFSEFDKFGGDASAGVEYGSDDEEIPF